VKNALMITSVILIVKVLIFIWFYIIRFFFVLVFQLFLECDCDSNGIYKYCDSVTGQCHCNGRFTGQRCDKIKKNEINK
jgi:hypothetical protein